AVTRSAWASSGSRCCATASKICARSSRTTCASSSSSREGRFVRVNLDWLRDFVALEGGAERVADDLTSSGLEVESVERAGAPLDGVVVAGVLSVARHPNADRLSVCTVSDGAAEVQVVCGAPNVAAGIKTPFARVGSTLPGGKAIGAAELRGVRSNGMLCSARELELPDDVDGLLLLDADAPVGRPV